MLWVRVVRITGYHLRNISFVRKYLDEKTMRMLVYNKVIGKLNYCNSLYDGLPNHLEETATCYEQSCTADKGRENNTSPYRLAMAADQGTYSLQNMS